MSRNFIDACGSAKVASGVFCNVRGMANFGTLCPEIYFQYEKTQNDNGVSVLGLLSA